MSPELKLTSAMALAAAGLMTMNYLEEQDIQEDTSATSQPAARNEYLANRFPQFIAQLNKLAVELKEPDKIWKEGKNQHHALYQMGKCSKLPLNWSEALATSFGQVNKWGRVQNQTPDSAISIHIKTHPEYVHIFMTEYNPSHFTEKAWYKSWRTSPSEVKSSYVMAINCEILPHKDRAP